jgi:hypothetical protein
VGCSQRIDIERIDAQERASFTQQPRGLCEHRILLRCGLVSATSVFGL